MLVVLGQRSWLGRTIESILGFPLAFTPLAAVLAATIHALPLMVKSVRVAFEQVDLSLENVARTLGAGELRVFWTITVPLAMRGIWAATPLAFARAMGDFGVTIMIAGNIPGRTQTASVAIYDAVQAGRDADALLLVGIVSVLALFPHMTVLQNVAFGLRQLPVKERETRVEDMLQSLEVARLARRKPGNLSGGEQQRVALARALCYPA